MKKHHSNVRDRGDLAPTKPNASESKKCRRRSWRRWAPSVHALGTLLLVAACGFDGAFDTSVDERNFTGLEESGQIQGNGNTDGWTVGGEWLLVEGANTQMYRRTGSSWSFHSNISGVRRPFGIHRDRVFARNETTRMMEEYRFVQNTWQFESTLPNPPGLEPVFTGDEEIAFDVDGHPVLVYGAYHRGFSGRIVHRFHRYRGSWTSDALTAVDESWDGVVIRGDLLLLGRGEPQTGSNSLARYIDIYRLGATAQLEATIPGSSRGMTTDGNRVYSVRYDPSGCPGAAGVLEIRTKVGSSWPVEQSLCPPAAFPLGTAERSYLAATGTELYIGDEAGIVSGNYLAGQVFQYELGPHGFYFVRKMTDSPSTFHGKYGRRVRLADGRVFIGRRWMDPISIFEPKDCDGDVLSGVGGLGRAVAASGDTMVVGAPTANDGRGEVRVYDRVNGTWVLDTVLTNLSHASGRMGHSVAVSASTIVVGAPYADRTFVYQRVGGNWTLIHTLAAPSPTNERYGWSVATAGDLVVVGAPYGPGYTGRAFVYELIGSNALLRASDAGAPGGQFGRSVATDGDSVAIGEPRATHLGVNAGNVHMWTRISGSTFSRSGVLTLPNTSNPDRFGESVAMIFDRVVVGAPSTAGAGSSSGSVHMFRYNGPWGGWYDAGTLVASEGEAYDFFGTSVAWSDEHLVVGAPGVDDAGTSAGAAYHFGLASGDWVETHKLHAPTPSNYARFGNAVGAADSGAVVGSYYAPSGNAAYQFDDTCF